MKFLLWVLFFVPTKECVERVKKDNLTNCREEFVGCTTSFYLDNGCVTRKNVCDEIKDPKPIPERHYQISMDEPDLLAKKDDCYDVYVSSIPFDAISEHAYWLRGVYSLSGQIMASTMAVDGIMIFGKEPKAAVKGKKK